MPIQQLLRYLPLSTFRLEDATKRFPHRFGSLAEFGLFECAIALLNPALEIFGYDLSESRIAQAKKVAKRLNLRNVNFFCQDVTSEGTWQ